MALELRQNPHPIELARRILELQALMETKVRATEYEAAARALDEREALTNRLRDTGNHTLIRNVNLCLNRILTTAPLSDHFKPKDTIADEALLRALIPAPVPIRWILYNSGALPVGTLRKRVNTESLESAYFRAKFPLVAPTTLGIGTQIPARLAVLLAERSRSKIPIVWVCADFQWLGETGVIDLLLREFQDPSFEFVACAKHKAAARQFVTLPNITEINAG